MTLRNFDTDLDLQILAGEATTTVVVTEQVTITPKPASPDEKRTWLLKPPTMWGWEELRDYVVHEIETRFGAFPRDFRKESGIFKSFCSRWGEQAGPIAIHAFEVRQGIWAGAPISVNRFCKNSDRFFANEIAKRL